MCQIDVAVGLVIFGTQTSSGWGMMISTTEVAMTATAPKRDVKTVVFILVGEIRKWEWSWDEMEEEDVWSRFAAAAYICMLHPLSGQVHPESLPSLHVGNGDSMRCVTDRWNAAR
jgi:hypothetical protein